MTDYRVTVKVRNNRILTAIEQCGGTPGQKWCEENGLPYALVNNLINMTVSPLNSDGSLRTVSVRLCDVVGKLPDDLWSTEQLYPLEKNFTELEMSHEQIVAMLPGNQATYELDTDKIELPFILEGSMSMLSARQSLILKARFWDGKTFAEIAKELDLSVERVRQIEVTALRRLRNPKQHKQLAEFAKI